jgi:lactoylglutathione lyase
MLDPEKGRDFYVNKLGMKLLGEMDLGSATTYFLGMMRTHRRPYWSLLTTTNRTEPCVKGYAHVAFTVDELQSTVASLKEHDVTVTVEPKTLTAVGASLQDRLQRGA